MNALKNNDIQTRLEQGVAELKKYKYVITDVYEKPDEHKKWAERFMDLTMADSMEFSRTHSQEDAWYEMLIQNMHDFYLTEQYRNSKHN